MRAGAPIWRASASASRASGTAPARHLRGGGRLAAMASWREASATSPPAARCRRPVRRNGRRLRTRRVCNAMFDRAAQMVSSTRQSGLSRRALASAARRHSSSVTVTSARAGGEHGADRESERIAGVPGRAGQPEQPLRRPATTVLPDLARRKAGQHRERGVDIARVDRPRPGREQVVLLGAEPDRPKHLARGSWAWSRIRGRRLA